MFFSKNKQAPEIVEKIRNVKEYNGVMIDRYEIHKKVAIVKAIYIEIAEDFTKSNSYKFDTIMDDGLNQIVKIEVQDGYVTALVLDKNENYFAVVIS